ncbi:vanadium-dependent haloperoxidase [Hymenobacter sp. 15J16-1T3B]|uniref:vanadium-dependent haloperoxidase n=1 Tax=Hymenobacter sp. 15J16-1T3B TaxID=2886941 RepID=UPI001D1258C0|nr:vanadium-dependent haloperoxidase [Hymenobacter sp. 15J16-1T3B]MCC3158941.1 vanadium-dependent haloperoxidase [Hymenobacter sp. 15J16-1T3B]
MKILPTRWRFGSLVVVAKLLLTLLSTSCSDDNNNPQPSPSPATSSYRADVAVSWLNMETRLARTTPQIPANMLGRPFAYASVAAYEAAVPGMAGYRSLGGQLNGLGALPTPDPNLVYNWALSSNAALAAVNRRLFANAAPAALAAIDSLEAATETALRGSLGAEVSQRSTDFGKQVAAAVLAWAATDGFDNTTSYTPPTGPGLWVSTPPAFAPAALANWRFNRPLVAGSGDGADPGQPTPYSTTPGSPFYAMVEEVKTIAQNRTPEQTAIALFWNDAANGRNFTPLGHWASILAQVLVRDNAALDKALVANAKMSIAMTDALISTMKTKYLYNVLRPVTYIRASMGQPDWLPLITTPAFPEYSSNHAALSAAAAQMLTDVFGPNYAFTDQNYAQFGLGTRSYTSFEQAATEAGLSRLYGGIHYRRSCEVGQAQGKQVAQNINTRLTWK